LPPTLRLTILRRISFLADDTLQALRFASVLGTGFTLTDLAEVTGRSAVDLSTTLAEPLRARVLEDDGTRLRFRHDLIRDAIYEDLPASVRGALHREAGQRLAAAGAPAAQVAEHLARGARRGDAEAIGWLARAARQAAVTSPGVAADLFGRAIGLTRETDEGRDRLMAERAGTLMLAGRVPAALTACRELLGRHHDPDTDGRVRTCLAHALLAQGRVGHGVPVSVTQGRLLIALDRLPEARSALTAGVRVSEELGVRWALATHRVYLAYERFAAGEWDDALAELEVSITVAEEVGE